MAELAFAWQWLWLHLAYRARLDMAPRRPATTLPPRADTARRDGVSAHPAGSDGHSEALRDLIERAAHDIHQGWPEAALDCLGRAIRLLERQP